VLSSTSPHDSYAALPWKIASGSNGKQKLSSAEAAREYNEENLVK
jgi:hypothetical protein